MLPTLTPVSSLPTLTTVDDGRPTPFHGPTLTPVDESRRVLPKLTTVNRPSNPFRTSAPIDTTINAASRPLFDKQNFVDAFKDIGENPSYYIPYLNVTELFDSAEVLRAVKAMESDTATDVQMTLVDEYIENMQSEKTFGFKFVSTVARLPAFAGEFLTAGSIIKGSSKGVIAKGLKGTTKAALASLAAKKGLKGLPKLSANIAAKVVPKTFAQTKSAQGIATFFGRDTGRILDVMRKNWLASRVVTAGATAAGVVGPSVSPAAKVTLKAAQDKAFKSAMGAVGVHLTKSAAAGVGPRSLLQAHRIANGIKQNMTPIYGLHEDEAGDLKRILIEEGDEFGKAFAKAYGDIAIENFSEATAEAFFVLRGMWGEEAEQFVKAAVLDRGARKLAQATGLDKNDALKKILKDHFLGGTGKQTTLTRLGWGGVLPEIGEEAIGGVLRQVTGISPIGLPDIEDVAVMALAFAFNPLSIGNYALDESTQHLDRRVKTAVNGLERIKRTETREGLVTTEESEDAVRSIRDYVAYGIQEGLSTWDKFKRYAYQNRAQSAVRQAWGEKVHADLDEIVKWHKAKTKNGEDPNDILTDDFYRRWAIYATGNEAWIETDAEIDILEGMDIVHMTAQEKAERGLAGAILVGRDSNTWSAEEIAVMDKYSYLFEVQSVADVQMRVTRPVDRTFAEKPWENLTEKEKHDAAALLTSATVGQARLERARQQYDLIRDVILNTTGEISFVMARKLALTGTRKEMIAAGITLAPEAKALARPELPDGESYAEDYEDTFMVFQGSKVNIDSKTITIDNNSSRTNIAEELVHIWSVGSEGTPHTAIMNWGLSELESLSARNRELRTQVDGGKLSKDDEKRAIKKVNDGEELLDQMVNEEGEIDTRMINELWSKLFKMHRLGHAVIDENGNVKGEADLVSTWMLKLDIELPDWADGIVNMASSKAPIALGNLRGLNAPYNPSASVDFDPETGEPIPVTIDEEGNRIGVRSQPPAEPTSEETEPPAEETPPGEPVGESVGDQGKPGEIVGKKVAKPEVAQELSDLKLTDVPGLGSKKLQALKEAGITSVQALREAIIDGRLQDVPGFGEKTVERLRNFLVPNLGQEKPIVKAEEVLTDKEERLTPVAEVTPETPVSEPVKTIEIPESYGTDREISFWFRTIKPIILRLRGARDALQDTNENFGAIGQTLEDLRNQLRGYVKDRDLPTEQRRVIQDELSGSRTPSPFPTTAHPLLWRGIENAKMFKELFAEISSESPVSEPKAPQAPEAAPEPVVQPSVEPAAPTREFKKRPPRPSGVSEAFWQVFTNDNGIEDELEDDEVAELLKLFTQEDWDLLNRHSGLIRNDGKPFIVNAKNFFATAYDDVVADRVIEALTPGPKVSRPNDPRQLSLFDTSPETSEEVIEEIESQEERGVALVLRSRTPQFSQDGGGNLSEVQDTAGQRMDDMGVGVDGEPVAVGTDGVPFGDDGEKIRYELNRPEVQDVLMAISPIGSQGETIFWEKSNLDAAFIAAVENDEAWITYLNSPIDRWFKDKFRNEDGTLRDRYWIEGMAKFFGSLHKPEWLQTELIRRYDPIEHKFFTEKKIIVANRASRGAQWQQFIVERMELRFRNEEVANESRLEYARLTGRLFTNPETGEQIIFRRKTDIGFAGLEDLDLATFDGTPVALSVERKAEILSYFSGLDPKVWIAADKKDKALLDHMINQADKVLMRDRGTGPGNFLSAGELRVAFGTNVFFAERVGSTGKDIRSHIQRAMDLADDETYLAGRFKGSDGKMQTTYIRNSDLVSSTIENTVISKEPGQIPAAVWAGRRNAFVGGGLDGKREEWNELFDDFWLLWNRPTDDGERIRDVYHQPVGQLSDHNRPYLVESDRLTTDLAKDSYHDLFVNAETGELLPGAQEIFDKGFAIPFDEAENQASKFRFMFIDGLKEDADNAERFYWNWLYNSYVHQRDAFGREDQYKGLEDRTKRSGSSISDFVNINPNPAGKDGLGSFLNVVYLNDEAFIGNDPDPDMPLFDGALYNVGETSQRMKNGMTAMQFPRHWERETIDDQVLRLSKQLHNSRRIDDLDARTLHKANTVDLDTMAENLPGSQYAAIKKFVDEYNQRVDPVSGLVMLKPWAERIHQIVPTSSAKVRDNDKDMNGVFKKTTGGYQFIAPALGNVKLAQVTTNKLGTQGPLVHTTAPRVSRFPSQVASIWMDLPSSEKITELDNMSLNLRQITYREDPLEVAKYLSEENNSDLIAYEKVLGRNNPLIASRINEVMSSKLEQAYLRAQAMKTLLQEVPFASDLTATDYGPVVEVSPGKWEVTDDPEVATQVRLAVVKSGIPEKHLRQARTFRSINFGKLTQFLLDNQKKYADLFVVDADGNLTDDLKTWEFTRNKDGKWIIPGGIMFLIRVPADEHHSVIAARQGTMMNTELDVVIMNNRLQEIGGSDNDGDQRHAVVLHQGEDGVTIAAAGEEEDVSSLYNKKLLLAAQDYGTVKMWTRGQRPVDMHAYDGFASKHKAGLAEDLDFPYGNTPEGYRQSFQIHKSRSSLVSTFARANATYMALRQMGFGLKPYEDGTAQTLDITEPGLFSLKVGRVVGKPYDPDGNLMVHIGTFLQMALDNGKDPKLEYLGINEVTAGMAINLLMMNGDLKTYEEFRAYIGQIAEFFNSDVVREFVKEVRLINQLGDNQGHTKKELFSAVHRRIEEVHKEGFESGGKAGAMSRKHWQIKQLEGLWNISEEVKQLSQTMKKTTEVSRSVEEHDDLSNSVLKILNNGFRFLDVSPLKKDGKLHPILHGLGVSLAISEKLFKDDILRSRTAEGVKFVVTAEGKVPLTMDQRVKFRAEIGRAFMLEAVSEGNKFFDTQAKRYSTLSHDKDGNVTKRKKFLFDVSRQIQKALHAEGDSNTFIDALVEELNEGGQPTHNMRTMGILRRGQLEPSQLEKIYEGFDKLASYGKDGVQTFTSSRKGKPDLKIPITGTMVQDMFVMESLWEYGATLSAGKGGWLSFVSPTYWTNKRDQIDKTREEWDKGKPAEYEQLIDIIDKEIHSGKTESEFGLTDEISEDQKDAFSVVLFSNWGRLNPATALFGSQELHQFLVSTNNWARAEYHNSLKIVDALQRMAGEGKLIGHVWIQHEDDDEYDIVDLNDSYKRIEFDEHGVPKFFDQDGNLLLHRVDGAKTEGEARSKVAKLDKELKERQPDDDSRMLASEVMEAITAVIENTTSDMLSSDHPAFNPAGKITITDSNGNTKTVPDYVVFKRHVKRAPVNDPGGELKKVWTPFMKLIRDRDGNIIGEQVARDSEGEEIWHANVVVEKVNGVGEVIDKIGRNNFARMVRMTREANHGRTRLNEKMAQLLPEEEWLSFLARYMMHKYKKKLPDDDKEAARAKAIALWGARVESGRAEARVFPDYLTAAMISGLEPVSMRADVITKNWYSDTVKTAANLLTMTSMMVTREMDGAPLVMPKLDSKEEIQREGRLNPMTERVLLESLQNAADFFNHRRITRFALKNRGEELDRKELFTISATGKAKDEWARFYKTFGKEDIEAAGYSQPLERSKFRGIENWWVRKASDHPGPYSNAAVNMIKMIEQDGDKEWKVFGKDWFIGIRRFNEWSKSVGLSFSLFHPFALLESFVALAGITVDNFSQIVRPMRTLRRVENTFRLEKKFGHLTKKWVKHGLMVNTTNPNFLRDVHFDTIDQSNQTLVQKDIDAFVEKERSGVNRIVKTPFVKGAKLYKWYLHQVDQHLWGHMFPAMKLYMAEFVEAELRANFESRGMVYGDGDDVKRDIARMINHALGGQNWHEYIWATPERMQLLHLMMFAPDWTLSAFNIAQANKFPGVNKVLRIPNSQTEHDWATRKYWPAMATIVMTGIPNAFQAAIYAIWGDPEEGDTPWIANNEPHKDGFWGIDGFGGHVDITPFLRQFGWVPIVGYKGDPSGKRRVYLRWAKQATEVFEGWLTKPAQTLFAKSSPSFRTAFEQATGTNTAGWELKFRGEGMSGFFQTASGGWGGGVMDSRIGYVGKKFVPMSIVGLLEGRPSAFFAPASRGVSLNSATTQLAAVLDAYADDAVWKEVNKKSRRVENLGALGPEILKAAEVNGFDPTEVVKRAKSRTLGKLYGEFFIAINNENQKDMEKLAVSINRVHGTLEGLERSMKQRFKQSGRFYSDEDRDMIRLLVSGTLDEKKRPAIVKANNHHNVNWIQTVLEKNHKKDFVRRIQNPDRYPILKLNKRDHATHMMAHDVIDGRWIVYPTVIFDKQSTSLIQLPVLEAQKYAFENDNFIEFDNEEDAEFFAINYKRVWRGLK